MANSRYYSSVALPTTLTSPIGTSDVQIQVASTFGFPLTLPYTLALDYGSSNEELVQVNNVGGLTLDITRAIDGTSASSHNPGAVVRHVSSARDFTDSRTHEASSTTVHGLTGAVVGTTDSQVLSNKTLTSPTINGGSMSGTITGTPTFNNAITFSSTAVMNAGLNVNNNLVTVTRGTSGSLGYAVQVTGDTISRWNILASGLMSWGAGGASATDSTLERAGTSLLRATDTELRSTRVTSTNNAYTARVTTDINDRFRVRADGQIFLGDGTNAPDVTLFRNAADVLRTNDSLIVDGSLTVSGVGQVLAAAKNVDTGRTTATLSDDPNLTFTVTANSTYLVEGYLAFNTTDETTADLVVGWTQPASSGGRWAGIGQPAAASATSGSVLTNTSAWNVTRTYGALVASELSVFIKGTLVVAGTGGTFALQFARSGGSGTVTLLLGSHMTLTRIL